MSVVIEPLRDADSLREYIGAYWAPGHILAREPAMTDFTYATPWVDRSAFPAGYSVLGAYDGDRLVGFIGSISAPYPRPSSLWLALWHVLPELKGSGVGGQLLRRMQDIALASDGWIGTFGASADALPVYLSRGYAARGVRRWIFNPSADDRGNDILKANPTAREIPPPQEWFDYRYGQHPSLAYERTVSGVFRTETNEWGRVTHAVWLPPDDGALAAQVHRRESEVAQRDQQDYLLDAWSFGRPGPHWELADPEVPEVFHPPQARGNRIYAVGLPFLPDRIQKGDCDRDRPN
jgi:GNAT superfamily N-acetyltransferase